MNKIEALKIVLALARENVVSIDTMEEELINQREDQLLAVDIVDDMLTELEAESKPKRRVKNLKLTAEQKKRFEPLLQRTWAAIAADCEPHIPRQGVSRRRHIIEIVCDANRSMDYGPMTKEDYDILTKAYHHRDTQKWLREVLNY